MQYTWYDTVMIGFSQAFAEMAVFVPKTILGIVVLLIGVTIAKLLRSVTIKFFESLRVSSLVKNTPVEQFFKNGELSTKVEEVLGSVVYWLLMLVVVHTAVTVVGLTSLSIILSKILGYLPHVFASVLILFIGILVSGIVESLVKGSIKSINGRSARLLGKVSSYLVLVLTVMMAISELGIASQFIMILFVGFVACLSLALGLAFGLGGQHIVKQLLHDSYSSIKKQVEE